MDEEKVIANVAVALETCKYQKVDNQDSALAYVSSDINKPLELI